MAVATAAPQDVVTAAPRMVSSAESPESYSPSAVPSMIAMPFPAAAGARQYITLPPAAGFHHGLFNLRHGAGCLPADAAPDSISPSQWPARDTFAFTYRRLWRLSVP